MARFDVRRGRSCAYSIVTAMAVRHPFFKNYPDV